MVKNFCPKEEMCQKLEAGAEIAKRKEEEAALAEDKNTFWSK